MTPLAFISGILLGTAFSIFFGLAVVALLFYFLGFDEPRIADEIGTLLKFSGLFLIMTFTSALGFIGLLKNRERKWWYQALMWLSWLLAGAWVVGQRVAN